MVLDGTAYKIGLDSSPFSEQRISIENPGTGTPILQMLDETVKVNSNRFRPKWNLLCAIHSPLIDSIWNFLAR